METIDQPQPARSSARVGALYAYAGALAYASLSPFFGWTWPEEIRLFQWPKYWTSFDFVANVVAYLPLGLLSVAALRVRDPKSMARVLGLSVAGGAAFSIAMELIQACLPSRVVSPLDVIANTSGTLLGASLIAVPLTRSWLRAVASWRLRHFAHQAETDWGLLLIALWLFAQLNPAIPFFEAGSIVSLVGTTDTDAVAPHPYDLSFLLPQVIGIALNVGGFALFVSLLLHPRKRVTVNVAAIVLLGFLSKIAMASLLFKAPQLAAWLTPATVIGLACGLAAVPLFSRIVYRWRALVATLLVFGGVFITKLTGVYGPFEETMKLFSWPYGHLATFTNLTAWVNEVWPFAAFVFLAVVFIKREWAFDTNAASKQTPERAQT